jgi:uncharacterized protein
MLHDFWENFRHNLFKPLLLFFYMGFSVPILKVAFEFPYVIYQGLTIYLLLSIGWEGGEKLANLSSAELGQAGGFMVVGFITNFFIGILAYLVLKTVTKLRRVDAATVAAYYGSDSAGTFATALGVLGAAHIAYAPYMPVMLAVMEIPGCVVGLFLISRMRQTGMDKLGNMPDEPGYDPKAKGTGLIEASNHGHGAEQLDVEKDTATGHAASTKPPGIFSPQLLHELFFNPGLFLLFGGIIIGFISGLQGHAVTDKIDPLLGDALFQGMLCLFLLEMGMTASRRLKDLKAGGWQLIVFGVAAPNVFATIGMIVAHVYSHLTGHRLEHGTYVLFAVLCGAASYIAVPAIQRIAIPEASPTLPLAASLGLTFSYNVTIGIPIYIEIAKFISNTWPVVSTAVS